MDIDMIKKDILSYECNECNFLCSKQYDLKRHMNTKKHKKQMGENISILKPNSFNICHCGKKYKERSGLWKHKQKCNKISTENIKDSTTKISNKLVVELINENKELRQILLEQNSRMLTMSKETKYITNNNTTNNFNLNFFLTDRCKDALNIMDFVNSLSLQMNDLIETSKIGYAEGISKILIRGLKELEIHKRPIHCSDIKRETLYIKDNDIWEKDDKEKNILKNVIQVVGNKNIKQIPYWVNLNPQCTDGESLKNEEYMNILSNTMMGSTPEEQLENISKVSKNVSKEVIIDKHLLG